MKHYQTFNKDYFTEKGLNLQAVFNLDDVPESCIQNENNSFTQLLLLAHAGRRLWKVLKNTGINSDNPIDDYSKQIVETYFQTQLPAHRYQILYPGPSAIGLRKLGELAGWHHDSPFRVGINSEWGSWFAYRAVVLCDTHFQPSTKITTESPCLKCSQKPCISACPANALEEGSLVLNKCITYRKQPESQCKLTCLSRVACPVAAHHRYSEEQINYHYGVSMKTIDKFY